jgi:hypothetical protein
MQIQERFRKARQKSREQHLEKEVQKKGNLRAGSSGIATVQGEVAGMCARKAHIRQMGIEIEQITEDKYIMFELGYANEDEIYKQLVETALPGEVVLREEEIPVEWYTTNQTKVTGRPDIVLCTQERGHAPIPYLGLELKSIHSMWTMRDVLFGGKPKLPHVVQAAHYMWRIGQQHSNPSLAWKIVYKSYSQLGQGMAGNDWIVKQFPRPGEPMSEHIEFNEKGQIKHLKQFEVVYDIRIDSHRRVEYKLETAPATAWTPSIVTLPDIERFFELVSQMEETGSLGPRPLTIDAHGSKLNYTDCSYCPLKEICDSTDKVRERRKKEGATDLQLYADWLQLVEEFSKQVSGS